jgi:hypothetical protein
LLKQTLMGFIFAVLLLSIPCFAQSNELGVLFGSTLAPDATPSIGVATCVIGGNCTTPIKTHSGITYEGVFAHRVFNAHVASVYVEFPIVGSSDRNIRQGVFVRNFSSIFFTPGLKLKLSVPVLSPFVSVGGGFAHFSPSTNGGTLPDQTSTEGAFQVGGGVDLNVLPHIALRGEVREFYTGKPDFSSNPHNIFVGGGLVLHF